MGLVITAFIEGVGERYYLRNPHSLVGQGFRMDFDLHSHQP
jgi:hypothetical protein